MIENCHKCGFPKDLCICGQIAKEGQKIVVTVSKRRFGKYITILNGFDKSEDLKSLASKLKLKLACGGTVKDGQIELQGDQRRFIKKILVGLGFEEGSITIK
jgi:translation initiation factor 1